MQVPEIYKYSGLYSSEDMFSPPAERRPHVIRFELTQGCPWGRCTYCCGFDRTPFQEKTLDTYKDHVDQVFHALKFDVWDINRLFIGGGDALAVETPKLIDVVSYTREKYGKARIFSPKRLAIYGSTRSINGKSIEELSAIKEAGVDLIYWGVESGSDSVLDYVNKGCTGTDVLEAAKKINKTLLKTSVMVMPGLGGVKYYDEHIKKTAEALAEIRPKFITFMGINADSKSAYARKMEKERAEGTNRPLTKTETIQQMAAIIGTTRYLGRGTKIGCFAPDVDGVGCNPLTFGTFTVERGYNRSYDRSDQYYLSQTLAQWHKLQAVAKIMQSDIKPADFALQRFEEVARRLGESGKAYFAIKRFNKEPALLRDTWNPIRREGITLNQDPNNPTIFYIVAEGKLEREAERLAEDLENQYLVDVRVRVK